MTQDRARLGKNALSYFKAIQILTTSSNFFKGFDEIRLSKYKIEDCFHLFLSKILMLMISEKEKIRPTKNYWCDEG